MIFPLFFVSCGKDEKKELTEEEKHEMVKEFIKWADGFEADLAKLYTNQATAYYNASINNTEENWAKFAEADKAMNAKLADSIAFKKIDEFRSSGLAHDAVQIRRVDKLYNMLFENQVPIDLLNQMTEMNSAIETKYGKFRAVVDGDTLSDNEIEEELRTSVDSERLRKVWTAHKKIGPVVAEDILELVKLRNQAAIELGFDNYHTMSLTLSEQDPNEIELLFDDLDKMTRPAFTEVKKEIDTALAEQIGISTEELMPWHYRNRYFQEAPKIFEIDLDSYYENHDVVDITRRYYESIGLPIEDMLEKSDLYENKETGKNQHAYCIDIDRDKKDIRVLCNVENNTSWMETMLHEFGHALYSYHVNSDLPWSLKEQAHIFTTEAVAMFFGRLATNPEWMQEMLKITEEQKEEISETCRKQELHRQLVFSRWVQVMYRFEKEMYANPDQDLNKLWWDLVEKYQMIKRPEGRNMPDWATKIHIATAPCYYHNYLLGEILASQFHYKLCKILESPDPKKESFTDSTKIAAFFYNEIFMPGAFYPWNDMIRKSTGEYLTPRYYAKQYVR